MQEEARGKEGKEELVLQGKNERKGQVKSEKKMLGAGKFRLRKARFSGEASVEKG